MELRRARDNLCETSDRICAVLLSGCKTVHDHDPWTCPVTVQHALQELVRALEIASDHVELVLDGVVNVINPGLCWPALERLRTSQTLPWPKMRDLQPYLDHIHSYLREDPGSR